MNVKIGDTVLTRFGESKIDGMTLTLGPNCSDGDAVSVVGIESVKAGKVIFDLDNGKWVWSHQVFNINGLKI